MSEETIVCILCGANLLWPGPRYSSHLLQEHGAVFFRDQLVRITLSPSKQGMEVATQTDVDLQPQQKFDNVMEDDATVIDDEDIIDHCNNVVPSPSVEMLSEPSGREDLRLSRTKSKVKEQKEGEFLVDKPCPEDVELPGSSLTKQGGGSFSHTCDVYRPMLSTNSDLLGLKKQFHKMPSARSARVLSRSKNKAKEQQEGGTSVVKCGLCKDDVDNLREHLQLDHAMTREKYVEILERSSRDIHEEHKGHDKVMSREVKLIESTVTGVNRKVTRKAKVVEKKLTPPVGVKEFQSITTPNNPSIQKGPLAKDWKDSKNTNCTICQEYFPTRKMFMKHCQTKHTASKTGKRIPRQSSQSTTKTDVVSSKQNSRSTMKKKMVKNDEPAAEPLLWWKDLSFGNVRPSSKLVKQSKKPEIKTFKCEDCGKAFPSLMTKRKHKIDSCFQLFPCSECNLVFSTVSKMNHHRNLLHYTEGYQICRGIVDEIFDSSI